MATQKAISPTAYVVTFVLLVLLTLLTVGVSFFPLPALAHYLVGLAIAAVKGALVVVSFMHALKAPRLTWAVIAVTGFWLGILCTLTLTDYFSRGEIPFMPGH